MNFLKFSLATVLSIVMMGQVAAATTERILSDASSSEAKWQGFLQALAQYQFADGTPGYNPETGAVSHAAVAALACTSVETDLCAEDKRATLVTEYVAVNNLKGVFVHQQALRLQAMKEPGVQFPLQLAAKAATPVAAASAPAPQVAPAPVPTIKVEEVAEIANQAAKAELAAANGRVDGLAQAMRTFNGQLADKDRAIAELRQQLRQAPSAAKVKELTDGVTAMEAERARLAEEIGSLRTQLANAPTEAQVAEAAEAAASGVVTPIARQVNTMTSGLKTTNERSVTALGIAAVALIAVLGSLIGLGTLAHKVKVQKRGVDLAFKSRDEAFDGLKDEVAINTASLPKRRWVEFPADCRLLVQALAMTAKEDPKRFVVKIEGVKLPVAVTVTHAKPGYVFVSGVPGHDPHLPVLLVNHKKSKTYTGFELLVMGAANRGAFDEVKLQTVKQPAAA